MADVQPQFKNLTVVESAINTYTIEEFEVLSIERMEVMEILA